jgi:IS605 OrfB family transposase
MLRTASILLATTPEQGEALGALRAAYAKTCDRLVVTVIEHRCWNRVALHNLAYSRLRAEAALGSQMACNAIFTVCKAYKAQSALGRIRKDAPVPAIRFDGASIHYDKRTYTLKGDSVSLYSLAGRTRVAMRLGEKHINHETSKAIVAEAVRQSVACIAMEDLTHIRSRIRAGRRMRARLHRWAFRQLQSFVEYKARAAGIEVIYLDPAYTSQICSQCRNLGRRVKHRFVCDQCGFRAHADLNASRNLAWIGGTAVPPRAAVSTPNVGNVGREIHVLQ